MTIAATMIVKNESRVIRRCLDSLRNIVDCAVIVDTGSTDDSQRVIREFDGFPIHLHERPWVNFGHNRTEAINLARPHGDYLLRVDADQTASGELPPPATMRSFDVFKFMLHHQHLEYRFPALFRASLPWQYVGGTHEYLHCPEQHTEADCDTLAITEHGDSHRRTSGVKFREDLEILEAEHARDPKNPRTVFYLAQTHEATGNKVKAVEFYKLRATMGSFVDEVFMSHFRIGKMRLEDGDGLMHLLRAWETCPLRWEPLQCATHWLNVKGMYHAAYALAKRASDSPASPSGLFVEQAVYDHLLAFDYACAAWHVGEKVEAIRVFELLLSKTLPANVRKVVAGNLKNIRGGARLA